MVTAARHITSIDKIFFFIVKKLLNIFLWTASPFFKGVSLCRHHEKNIQLQSYKSIKSKIKMMQMRRAVPKNPGAAVGRNQDGWKETTETTEHKTLKTLKKPRRRADCFSEDLVEDKILRRMYPTVPAAAAFVK